MRAEGRGLSGKEARQPRRHGGARVGRRRGREAGQQGGGEGEGASHLLSPDEMKSGSVSMLANIVCEKNVQMGADWPTPDWPSASMVEHVWSSASMRSASSGLRIAEACRVGDGGADEDDAILMVYHGCKRLACVACACMQHACVKTA